MSRRISAFAVFDQRDTLQTVRLKPEDAKFAARVIGGTDWLERGYTVEPVIVERIERRRRRNHHPDMIEE